VIVVVVVSVLEIVDVTPLTVMTTTMISESKLETWCKERPVKTDLTE
jgi:hypothetical protein